MQQVKKLNEYETLLLKTETVEDPETGTKYTGLQIYERLSKNHSSIGTFISEENYNYLFNLACTNAVLERIFQNSGL